MVDMTTNDELLATLGATPNTKRLLLSMAEASRQPLGSVIGSMLDRVMEPFASETFGEAYISYAGQLRERNAVSRSVTVRIENGIRYNGSRERLCSVDDCFAKHNRSGFCSRHAQQADLNYIAIVPLRVNSDGTMSDAAGVKLCKWHDGNTCPRKAVATGFCNPHYMQNRNGNAL